MEFFTGRKWTLEEAQAVTPLKLEAMDVLSRAQLAQFYQNYLNLRVASYRKAGVEPFAFTKLVDDFDKARDKDARNSAGLFDRIVTIKGNTGELTDAYMDLRNPSAAINQYIYRMKAFFSAKSATISGWNEITKAQDIQLFGATYNFRSKYVMEKGADGKRHRVYLAGPFVEIKPNSTLSDEERKKLWQIIDLAKDAGYMNVFGYSSEQTHRELASMFKSGEFVVDDIDAAHAKILDIIARKQGLETKYEEHAPGVSGDVFRRNAGNGGDNVWK